MEKIINVPSKSSKTSIYTFDPVIYPVKLFVSNMGNPDTLNKEFRRVVDTDGNWDEIYEEDLSGLATTMPVAQRGTRHLGLLVNLAKRPNVNTMAHEASHVAGFVCDHLGLHNSDYAGEARAYLTGWVAECISKSR